MKKIRTVFLTGILLSFLIGVLSATAQNIKQIPPGAFTPENIKKLPQLPSDALTPEEIKQLPPDIQERIKQERIKQEQAGKEQTGQEQDRVSESDIEDARNKLKEDEPPDTQTEDDNGTDEDDLREQGTSARVSVIEEQYREGYSSTLSSNLSQFGYDIFNSASIQETSLAIPDPNYVLGTGDQLSIRLWGSGMDAQFSTTVEREGTINVPQIGIMHVAGVKYGDIESVIKKEAEKYIQGINISVILTKLRSIEIFVIGSVRNPGLHVVPAFSTIFDGLLRAGGVKKTGSLRKITLNRANETEKTFDIYDLLLKGNTDADAILANKDVIFVPGIGKTAAIAGGVVNEGIFEVTREKNIQDLVKMAGGVLPQASGSRIYLRRFENNQDFIIHDINTASMKEWANYPIKNGDLVEVKFSLSQLPKVVRLQGHVWLPDVFKYKVGMKLSDVLTSPALLMPDAVTEFALIHRYDMKTTRNVPMQFPLSKVFTKEFNAPLQPYDRIHILSRENVGIQEKFSIIGAVWKPGEYDYKNGLKLIDALALAGGVKSDARKDRIEIARKVRTDAKFETEYLSVDLEKDADFKLQAHDRILVPKLEDYFVRLEGHVWYPDKIRYHAGMKLSDILISKKLPRPEDLLKPDVLMDFGLIERYDAKSTRTTTLRFPLDEVFTEKYDTALHPFDVVKILSRKDMGIEEKFRVNGAVWNPGEFEFQPGLRLKDALALAGGLKFGARTQKIEVARLFIKQDRVMTEYLLLDSEKDKDFLLQSSDAILVPLVKNASRIAQVSVSGEVAYPGTYSIRQGERISELIQRAGGFSEYAYFYGAKYTSEAARIIQQKSIDQMIEKLRMSLSQAAVTQSQKAVSEEDIEAAMATEETSKDLLRQLSSIKAEGRISIKMADMASFKDSLFDFRVKDGDALHIPPKPSFVSVVGSVYSPGSFLYEPNKTLNYYLEKSGGASKTADTKYMYLLKANGEILSMTQHNGFFSKFGKTVLMPGDTVVVPENLERVPYLRLVKDIADIAFKIATTAGVAFAIAL